jgi:YVTN family beta-propeller protein
MKRISAFSCLLVLPILVFSQKNDLQVPSGDLTTKITEGGVSVLPSGRFVTPVGTVVRIERSPFGLAINGDGTRGVILHHSGVVTVFNPNNPTAAVRVPSYDGKIKGLDNASFLGVTFDKDGETAYLSGGDNGNVLIFNTKTYQKMGEIKLDTTLNGEKFEDSFTSDLTIDTEGGQLLVLDRGNNRLVRVDLKTKNLTASIPVGRIPFGIALSPDHKTAFVANVGLFDYPTVTGVTPTNKDSMYLKFPPYGIPSKEAEEGITLPDGRKIAGLGSLLAEEAMSVWAVDLTQNKVVGKFKTGYQIGEKIEEVDIVGGASPNSVAVGSRFAYVSNATNDLISIIDYRQNKLIGDIKLTVDKRIDGYRGLMPFGLCLSKDEKTLYVALLGFNAVAVVDIEKRKTKGLIPTGWGTTRVQLSPDEKRLFVLSARGLGAGPNGGAGFVKPPQGTYVGDIQLGTLQAIDLHNAPNLLNFWTKQTLANTFKTVKTKNTPPQYFGNLGKQNPIQHVVYITKENRTYDEVFGQIKGANGDASLARFGLNIDISNKAITTQKDSVILRGVSVTPNHHKLAKAWSFSDNFYCDSDASIHGHHWMMGQMPNEYVEANSAAAGRFMVFSKAKGRRFPKTTGGIDPEDYNERGGIWENMVRNGKTIFNFGESNEFANAHEEKFDTIFGAASAHVAPLPKVLFDNTSRDYAGYNTNIPDQFRVEQFEREFTRRWLAGRDTMPNFIGIQLPNDHTSGERPADGYPFRHSYVADNDLALGRMIAFLSQTKYWKNMLIVVTEDDPQGGVDHVDAHRSILMMVSPYVKRGYVSHRHANFGSILKTIYRVLGVPYVNQYDATATLLDDFFTEKPDFTPYQFEKTDDRIFDPKKAMRIYGRDFDWRKLPHAAKLDDEDEQRKDHYKQQNGQ